MHIYINNYICFECLSLLLILFSSAATADSFQFECTPGFFICLLLLMPRVLVTLLPACFLLTCVSAMAQLYILHYTAALLRDTPGWTL